MTMPIATSPQLMREVAAAHDQVADTVDAARMQAEQIMPTVSMWGAISHGTKQAAADKLAELEQANRLEAAQHRRTAGELRKHASAFEERDDANAAQLESLT